MLRKEAPAGLYPRRSLIAAKMSATTSPRGLCAEVSLAMDTNADSVRFQVTLADHEHGMDLLLLGALNLSIDLIC